MKKTTENRDFARTLAEKHSSRKGMSPILKQQSPFTFPQETPMKPSQVPNMLSPPPLRRVLPFETPEQHVKDKFNSEWNRHHPAGPERSRFLPNSPTSSQSLLNPKDRVGPPKHFAQPPGRVPSSPVNTGTSVRMSQPRERQGPQRHIGQSEPGHFCSSPLVPPCPSSNNISSDRPSFSIFLNSPSAPSVADFKSHTLPCSSSDGETESKVTSIVSGSNSEKSHQYEQIPSGDNFVPAMDLNRSSQKRHKEFEPCSENAKKPCLQDANSGRNPTVKLTLGKPPISSMFFQLSLNNPSVLELSSPRKTGGLLVSKPTCGQSTSSKLLSKLKPSQTHLTPSPKHCPKKSPSAGQEDSTTAQGNLPKLCASSRPSQETAKKENEKKHKSGKSSSSKCPQEDSGRSRHVGPASHYSSSTKGHHTGGIRKSHSSTPRSSSEERSKPSRVRGPAVPGDINELFTPDPVVYVVNSSCKTAKTKMVEKNINSQTLGTCSSPAPGCVPPVTTSSGHMTSHSKVTGLPPAVSSSEHNLLSLLPVVSLKHIKLERLKPFMCPKNSPGPCSERQLTVEAVRESVKVHHKQSPSASASPSLRALDTPATKLTRSPPRRRSLPLERWASERSKKEVNEEDPADVELDLGLSITYDIKETQSSDGSEEEELVSFQEIMERVTKVPDTPEKEAFSEPSTPGLRSSQSKTVQPSTTKAVVYKNSLDQMLKEFDDNKRAKEVEMELLTACNEGLLKLAEFEESEENQDVSSEQQEFLQRYSLMSAAIREVPPGETVFNLERFGQIFNEQTLQLRQCMVNPQGTAQKTLLWSSPAQLRLHLNIGLFQESYNCNSPCPTQVSCFLFKMMSVHKERMLSEKILQALCDIACTAAYQIVKMDDKKFEVWVPSLADLTLVLINMGVAFVTLFPFEHLQPSFTEGDVLGDIYIKSESPSNNKEEMIFPEHNLSNIFKYLSYCMGLCPRAYSDDELLLLLTIVGRISLETRCILQSRVEVSCLQYKIFNNIRDWSAMLPRICQALTNLTDDHHNMCLLVQLLPDNARGKNLRQHLSMSCISKLLDGTSIYRPPSEGFQLADLRPYLPRMRPSVLFCVVNQKDKEGDTVTLDQQAYYLCYSLLTLMNEASNFHIFPQHQKAQLLALSNELETHVKCYIRESAKCLYRSKVKDLLARIYTKWQMLLRKIRPLDGKLYDYWQPADIFRSTQEDEECTLIEDEEDETTLTSERDGLMVDEKEEDRATEKMVETEGEGTEEDMSRSEGEDGDSNQSMPGSRPHAVDEPMDICAGEC
uniref:Family with sequence similarity 178, member A n=1 Tax=Nothobranchius rachovii TaxID=451742 RepID=A0A1A8QPY9_9TELE